MSVRQNIEKIESGKQNAENQVCFQFVLDYKAKVSFTMNIE